MTHKARLTTAALAATLMMLVATAATSANRLSVSNRNIRTVWTALEFREPAGFFGTVKCPVTLEGSFHYWTIAKREKALIGHISRASLNGASCTGGHATVLTESLPWHGTYQGFTGTLPDINEFKLLLTGVKFKIESALAGNCLATATVEHPVLGKANVSKAFTPPLVTTFTLESAQQIPLVGAPTCNGANGVFSNGAADGEVTLLGNTTKIKITLI
jgi:hypothetical protein